MPVIKLRALNHGIVRIYDAIVFSKQTETTARPKQSAAINSVEVASDARPGGRIFSFCR